MSDADVAEQLERHLNSPKQTWLLGAGISFSANIPLMYPLTERVLELVRADWVEQNARLSALDFLVQDCGENAHIEHILTHLGDFISLADRSARKTVRVGGADVPRDELVEVHRALVTSISNIVRWGYVPAKKGSDGTITEPARSGKPGGAIVTIDEHLRFIEAIFARSRAGLDFVRSPVEFFTTNYDTLVEDALALKSIPYRDGFVGGGIAFWDPKADAGALRNVRAAVTKLHGSIDWHQSGEELGRVFRLRDGLAYPEEDGSVMIYPQATKYINTQRDPFAHLFQSFRNRLADSNDHVCMVCGYSFGDDHIDAEIEAAMASPGSQLTLVAFAREGGAGLPERLEAWRRNPRFGDRVFVASQNGLYHGAGGPHFSVEGERNWWSFAGVAELIATGLPKDIQEAI